MNCGQIIKRLEQEVPVSMAEHWDNPGLQVGRRERDVHKVYLALDVTDEVIRHCVDAGAELLITHHPLLFSGLKQIHDRDFLGKRVIDLIRNDIACYAMHTNFDVMGMADAAADARPGRV